MFKQSYAFKDVLACGLHSAYKKTLARFHTIPEGQNSSIKASEIAENDTFSPNSTCEDALNRLTQRRIINPTAIKKSLKSHTFLANKLSISLNL